MKARIIDPRKKQRLTEHQQLIRATVKQMIIAMNETDGVNLGKVRINRVIDTWCSIIEDIAKDPDTMLIIDRRLEELGIDCFDKEPFLLDK